MVPAGEPVRRLQPWRGQESLRLAPDSWKVPTPHGFFQRVLRYLDVNMRCLRALAGSSPCCVLGKMTDLGWGLCSVADAGLAR